MNFQPGQFEETDLRGGCIECLGVRNRFESRMALRAGRMEPLPDLYERTSLDGGIVGEKEVDVIKVVRFKGAESALH